MSISFESAVETLKVMFPDWDEETLSSILISNQYHVERTIETVLSMQGDSVVEPPSQEVKENPREQFPPIQNNNNNSKVPTADHKIKAIPSSSQSKYRGTKCELPPEFLRPPGWQQSKHIIADEELAMMLQNELFQNQVRAAMGDQFLGNAASGSGNETSVVGGISSTNNSNTTGVRPANVRRQPGANEDMGFLKALSSMGTAAKRNLTQLALSFNSNTSTTGNGNNSSGGNSTNSSGGRSSVRNSFSGGSSNSNNNSRRGSRDHSSGINKEFQPFADDDNDIEEDGTEVITFGTTHANRSRHMLQDNNNSNNSSRRREEENEEEDPNDSENPLLMYNNDSYGGGNVNNITIKKKA